MDFLTILQPLTLEWLTLDQRFPNFFERVQKLSLVNTSRLSSFLISAIYSSLTDLRYRQTQTSSGNVENIQLRFESPGRDPFWPFVIIVWASGITGLDELTNRCVNCGETYFVNLEQSRGDNRLCLRFRKYPTQGRSQTFSFGGHWRGQFCNKGSCQWSV